MHETGCHLELLECQMEHDSRKVPMPRILLHYRIIDKCSLISKPTSGKYP